jgi:hypothetical protein
VSPAIGLRRSRLRRFKATAARDSPQLTSTVSETAYIWLAHKHYCATCLSASFERQLSPLPSSIIDWSTTADPVSSSKSLTR